MLTFYGQLLNRSMEKLLSSPGIENYDASKRNSYIMYPDANNLYEWAMSQPLSTFNFKWLTDEEMKGLHVMMIPDDSSVGYILECDLGKYYFYYLYIYVYFTKCNVSFLCISEYPLMNFMIYTKITRLHLNVSR